MPGVVAEHRGGATLGGLQASWPLAQLRVSAEELTVCVRFLGTYSFKPEEVTAILVEPRHLTVQHVRTDCPRSIIFHAWKAEEVSRSIKACGFVPSAPEPAERRPSGTPLKFGLMLVYGILWVAFLGVAFKLPERRNEMVLVVLWPTFLVSWLLLRRQPGAVSAFLRPGRRVSEIEPELRLTSFLTGLIGFAVSAYLLIRHFA